MLLPQVRTVLLETSNLGVEFDLRLFVHFSSIQRHCMLYSHVILLHIICTYCDSTVGDYRIWKIIQRRQLLVNSLVLDFAHM